MLMLSMVMQRVRLSEWGIGSGEPLQRHLLHIQVLVFDNHVHVRMRRHSRSVFDSTDGALQETADDLVRTCKFSAELFTRAS